MSAAPRSRNFFDREPDGSVRLRIRFDSEEADLIEEAAGDTGLLLWLHRTWRAAATRQVDEARRSRPRAPQIDSDENSHDAEKHLPTGGKHEQQ